MKFPVLIPSIFDHPFTYSSDINLNVGDYVELFVYHNEGSTEPTEESRTWFGGFRI